MKLKILLLNLLFFCFITNIFAKHIIGGIITYEYKDNGKYQFTMKIYRDCNSGGAVLDGDANDRQSGAQQFANVSVFKEISAGQYSQVDNLKFLLSSKKKVLPPEYPCLGLPPDICVEEGTYVWEYTIADFPSNATYHFVYQRCCRNNTIKNLVNPKDLGATYTVAISPKAMIEKNSTPVFKEFPPTVLCASVPFKFDHSAIDKDGDVLVYKLCSPLDGAGPNLQGSDCNSARPQPACKPPFDNVPFSPGFTATSPLGAVANLAIDPNTGIMTGEPKTLGQFVVGVCIEEYRNGVLLSKIFRDFQFNVESCDALVLAGVAASDTSKIQKKYTIRSCGSDEVKFVNGSTQEQYIKSYLWNFTIGGKIVTSTEKNPTIKFPALGVYSGLLIANPGLKPCSDTAKIEVQIFPAIKANYSTIYDTCIAGPVQFTDLSVSNAGAGAITKWAWNYDDKSPLGTIKNPSHIYKIPGNFKVKLRVEDKNKCVDTLTKVLKYFPVPPLLIIKPDTGIGCQPVKMRLKNLSYPIDNSYKIEWDLGDGSKSGEISPVHTYKDAGIFSLNLKVTSPIGCKTQASFPNLIEVKASPKADFDFTPEKLNSLQNTAKFTDKSMSASKWTWQFGKNEGSSSAKNPTYTFQDTGLHVIRLVVTHPSGCRDTLLKSLDIEPVIKYFLPNAFTPNYDGVNDEFKSKGIYDGISKFSMIVVNRWGEKVFETSNVDDAWNGQIQNTGTPAPEGVYVYYVNFIGPRNKTYTYKGFATLLR